VGKRCGSSQRSRLCHEVDEAIGAQYVEGTILLPCQSLQASAFFSPSLSVVAFAV
jgi:hypothetical protein